MIVRGGVRMIGMWLTLSKLSGCVVLLRYSDAKSSSSADLATVP